MTGLITLLVLALITYLVWPRNKWVAIANWYTLIDGMQFSSELFYTAVSQELKTRQVPAIRIGRRTFATGSILSHKRLYMEIQRGSYMFHVCAAPFGTGFFVSWWLREKLSWFDQFLMKWPGMRKIVEARQDKPYYYWDTGNMFKTTVQNAVLGVIDQITNEQGVRGLRDHERMPSRDITRQSVKP